MRQVTLEDVGRQYSQAAEEPPGGHRPFCWPRSWNKTLSMVGSSRERFRNAFRDANRREFEAHIYALVKNRIATSIYVLDETGSWCLIRKA
ncbi:MAG: hypothetical protein R3F31_18880 [Verrucomicrobiales bacterium]